MKTEIKKYNFIQWISLLSVYMLFMQMGMCQGWASPNFARLISKDSPVSATPDDISWMIFLSQLGLAFGGVIGSIFVEYIGSRKTIISTYVLYSISWICLLVPTTVEWLYASRFLSGIPTVMTFASAAIYLGEISRPEIRGTLISFAITGFSLGVVLGTIIETYVPSKISSSLYLCQTLLGTVITIWLKDTPYYFVKKNNVNKAKKSIEFYRNDVTAEKELENIMSFIENNDRGGIRGKLRECRTPIVKISMFLIVIVCGLPFLSGYPNITSYMEIILISAEFNIVKPEEFVIYSNLIGVIVSILSIQLVDKIGRKQLLILSSVGTGLAMFALGLHFHLLSVGYDAKTLQWLPSSSIIMYLIAYLTGYALMPGTLLSEMFPENVKSVAAFAGSLSGSLCGLTVGKAYQPIVNSVGEKYAFWTHGSLSLIGIPCALFLMVETKGKTFTEIQNKLSRKWNS